MHQPGRPATKLDAIDLRDPLVQPETGDRPGVRVLVGRRLFTMQDRDDVVAQVLGLPNRVLRTRPAERRGVRLSEVRNRRTVTRGPRVVETLDAQERGALQPALAVDRQV